MTLFWMTAKDWIALYRYKSKDLIKSSGTTFGRLFGELVVTKILYFTYILVIPAVFSGLSIGQVILGWMVMHAVTGLILASIFQPAHVLEELQFVEAEAGAKMEDDPLSHQLKTTANFGTGSKLFTWMCGGLNHQIEHHLFPQISHIHFSALAPIVKKTAEEFGLPYRSSTTFRWSPCASHKDVVALRPEAAIGVILFENELLSALFERVASSFLISWK